jgi:hypothetical protein
MLSAILLCMIHSRFACHISILVAHKIFEHLHGIWNMEGELEYEFFLLYF